MNLGEISFKRARRMLVVCMTALVGLGLVSIEAQAHKVNVFAYVEGDRVVVEGYFSAKVKTRNCTVEVFDEAGKKIHEGKTDEKGIYSFKPGDLPPFSGGLRIVLEAGMGHKADYALSTSDIPSSGEKDASPKEQPRKNESQPEPVPTVVGATPAVDQAMQTAAFEAALDKKLDPLIKMVGRVERALLEEKHAGPKLSDIVGGLGWIVGLVGITAFFWGRNRSQGGGV